MFQIPQISTWLSVLFPSQGADLRKSPQGLIDIRGVCSGSRRVRLRPDSHPEGRADPRAPLQCPGLRPASEQGPRVACLGLCNLLPKLLPGEERTQQNPGPTTRWRCGGGATAGARAGDPDYALPRPRGLRTRVPEARRPSGSRMSGPHAGQTNHSVLFP